MMKILMQEILILKEVSDLIHKQEQLVTLQVELHTKVVQLKGYLLGADKTSYPKVALTL